MAMPPMRYTEPKVNRGEPVRELMPMVDNIRPMTAPMRPLITFLEEILVTMLSPNMASAKYSAAPNFRANLLRRGAVQSSITALNRPPKVEAMVEMPMARPGWPSLVAMG